MATVEKAMNTLTAQWYNAMVTGLGLDSNSFQLYQGPNSMMNTSQVMWNMLNAVPPKSINNYNNPTQINNFSSDYVLILEALHVMTDSDFVNCMGDYYSKWQTYFIGHMPETINAETVTKVFNSWAVVYAPSQAGCVTALTKLYNDPIKLANVKLDNLKTGEHPGVFAWNQTVEQLKSALAGGAEKTFTMNSKTATSDVTHTWAGGNTSFFFDIFSFGGGGSYDKLTTKTTEAGLTIDAKFTKLTTFTSGPLAQNDPNDSTLRDYKAWYESAVLAKAYTTKDNTVWNNQSSTTWEKAFGANGFLQRSTSSIVVADGIEITMTSKASYTTAEHEEIKGAASAGIWPFFSVSGQGGTTTDVKFNDDGSFTCTTKIALGNPQILGILQSPMSKIFG